MRIVLAILLCVFLIGCKNSTGTKKNIDWNKNWYKRYTGTVGGQKVVAYFYYLKGNREVEEGLAFADCSYFYKGSSDIISLGTAKLKNGKLQLTEERPASQGGSYTWSMVVNDKGAKGMRVGHDKKNTDIDLKEDYSGGASPLDIISSEDPGFCSSAKGATDIVLMVPSPEMNNTDATFLEKSLLHMVGGDTMGLKSMAAYLKTKIKDFKKDEENGDERAEHLSCVSNDNGLLQFELREYALPDGAVHGGFWSTYSCIDVQKKKVWHLSDIMQIDSAQICNLLDDCARQYFKLSLGDDLSNYLLVDHVPPTENFILSADGIAFCYSPVEIAGFAYGDLNFFIPFSKIQSMLKPEFKKRMNL